MSISINDFDDQWKGHRVTMVVNVPVHLTMSSMTELIKHLTV